MQTIHVALAFDDKYSEQSIVLMTSILHNKDEEKIHFHIADGGLSQDIKKQISNIQNCEITFHLVNKEIFQKYIKKDYYSESMLYSMILPDLISEDKLIYLDCDIVVNTSLKELWNIDFENNYIAAVEDANGKKYAKRFKMPPFLKFFNSGVMLINCKKWRQDDISSQAIEMSMKNTGTKLSYDQNVLNKLFEGNVKFLDLKWNLQYCPFNVWEIYDERAEYKNAIKNPAIIHYVGDFKPWKKGLGCFNPKQKDYLEYHKLTSFSYSDYKKWKVIDKLMSFKGIYAFIKRYPLFFLRKQFWQHLIINSYS